jgi:hypothetical protein
MALTTFLVSRQVKWWVLMHSSTCSWLQRCNPPAQPKARRQESQSNPFLRLIRQSAINATRRLTQLL